MKKYKILLMLLLVITLPLLLVACDDDDEDSYNSNDSPWKERKESKIIAEDFLKNSPTFLFDGIESSIDSGSVEPAGPGKWRFLFSFYTRYEGTGDRSAEKLVEKQTYHEAYITIEDGEVIKGVIDNQWDMIDQEGTDDWEWSEAGEQALYGVISVFTMLVLLIILTRVSSKLIAKYENSRNMANSQQ